MYNEEVQPTRSPTWWKVDHDSAWTRVKAALRRDWEQTKSDFTGGKKGADLDQNVDDTVGQALGNRPIPVGDAPNLMTPAQRAAQVRDAAKRMEGLSDKLAKDAEKTIARNENPTAWNRWNRWEEAEVPLRYGYSAAAYYPDAWNHDTELRLRGEWDELYPDQAWHEVRDTVRRGWDEARI